MAVFDKKNIEVSDKTALEKPLIMLVDDEIENLNVLKALLESHYQIITGLNGKEALSLIDNMVDPQQIQLIISDQRMPHLTGTAFFEKIIDRMPDTIRIILTGYSDIDAIMDAINKAKIYKFITKPFEPPELLMTVKRGIEAFEMGRQLAEYTRHLEQKVAERTKELEEKNHALNLALEEVEKASLTDPLTGAHNRRFVMKFMPQELAKIHRDYHDANGSDHSDVGFLLLDLDHFKQVNDSYGHDAGDLVLKQVVDILTDVCRQTDWIVRWGGEEFLIVSRFSDREEIQFLAERIRQRISEHPFDVGQGQTISCSCSIGVTAYPLSIHMPSALSWQNTLNLADLALYRAKQSGRDTWIYLQNNCNEDPKVVYSNALKDLKGCIVNKSLTYVSSKNSPDIIWN